MQIKEFKCTCVACGNTWYHGYEEVLMADASAKMEAGKALMCCGGCFAPSLLPKMKTVEIGKCPKCGSRAIKKEKVVHEV